MEKLKKMSKEIFKENLILSLKELLKCPIEDIMDYKFMVISIIENGKNYNSKDDLMRLWGFSEKNIAGRTFDLENIVKLFSGLNPLYPMWIEVSIYDSNNKIVQLRHSLRFRKPSEIQNVDTGHPPFRIIE